MPEAEPHKNFSRYPMMWLAAAFAVGIVAASVTGIGLLPCVAVLLASAVIAFLARGKPHAAACVLIAFSCAGAVSSSLEKDYLSADRVKVLYDSGAIRSGEPVELEGVLANGPEPTVEGRFLNLKADKITYHGNEFRATGNVRLFLPEKPAASDEGGLTTEMPDLRYGSRLRIACKLSREDEFLNPGVIPKRELLDRLGVDATGSIKSPLMVEKLADESVFIPLAWVYERRETLIRELKGSLSNSAAGIVTAAVLGDKHFLDKPTADVFREGGTFHMLVISGLHITFMGGLLLILVRLFTRNRWIQFIVAMAVMWSFALAVGAHLPVIRAAIMFTVLLFSYVIYREARLLNSLGLCTFILLVWRPSDLFDASFQLTFVSVAAIVAMAYPLIEMFRKIGSWAPSPNTPFPPNVPNMLKRFCETLYWSEEAWSIESKQQIWTAKLVKEPYLAERITDTFQKALRYIFEAILVSLTVQIWMLPLMVWYFHRVSMVSVLLNIWVGIFLAIESLTAVIAVWINHFSTLLASPLFTVVEMVNWLLLSVPKLFVDNGWASFRLPAYSGVGRVWYAVYFIPVLFFTVVLARWDPFSVKLMQQMPRLLYLRTAAAALAILIGIIVFHPFSAPRPDGRLHIDFLDVGQGDAALITFPDGRTMMVDGGGRFRQAMYSDDGEPFEPDMRGIGEAVVSEFLWDRGYSAIDHILATHADADHMQGLTDVAKNFSIGSAVFARMPMDDPEFAELADTLNRRAIPTESIARGDRLVFGNTVIEVLYPIADEDPNAVSDNDHSAVLRIVIGNRAFLMTGDIEKHAETDLLSGGGTLAADLIKVAHHGSRTSSTPEFINAVGAKYAVISVGRRSPFGHPHPEVVDRWINSGAKVMTTGENGTISVSTDGNDLEISRYQP